MYAHLGPEVIDAVHDEHRSRLLLPRRRSRTDTDWGGLLARSTEL